MKIYKPEFWSNKNLISYILLPISIILQLIRQINSVIIKEEKFNIPVICIGNIYIGGTGKTPLSIEIANFLKSHGKNPVIIKKFYKAHSDEHNMIKNKGINLIASQTRKKGIDEAISNNFDVIILDDGFQDSSIFKNLNIICFNEKQLFGNEMTLPSGPLREPLSSLKKCKIVLINGNKNENLESKINNISKDIVIYYSKYSLINNESLKNKNLLAFAGIGNPENFFDLLKKNKFNIVKHISFPDHYEYSLKELHNLLNYAKKNNLEIVTTEKDFFRIKHHKIDEIKFLPVKLEIFKRENFFKEIKINL
tara:strand:+ start:1308 stop:2234 length:927 start_codon:yes stop_codon:yes gene_type:complete